MCFHVAWVVILQVLWVPLLLQPYVVLEMKVRKEMKGSLKPNLSPTPTLRTVCQGFAVKGDHLVIMASQNDKGKPTRAKSYKVYDNLSLKYSHDPCCEQHSENSSGFNYPEKMVVSSRCFSRATSQRRTCRMRACLLPSFCTSMALGPNCLRLRLFFLLHVLTGDGVHHACRWKLRE